jgi:hypothetical protein
MTGKITVNSSIKQDLEEVTYLFFCTMSSHVIGAFLLAFASGTTMTLCFRFLANMSPFLTNAISGFVFGVVCLLIWWFMGGKTNEIVIHPATILL